MSVCGPKRMHRASCSKCTPEYPAAHASRPQLGSWPKMADFANDDDTTDLAMSRASSREFAPFTLHSMRHVAPSPSHAMDLAMPTHTAVKAASSFSASGVPAAIGSPPAAPDARPMTQSLVLVSPSTEIWLKELTDARLTIARHASGSTFASHVTTPSMVAMFGWIIPLPLPMPPIRTLRPPRSPPPPKSTSTASVLRTRSVVQIAVAAPYAASLVAFKLPARDGTAAMSSSILIRLPMTPVDWSKISDASHPSASATVAAERTASSMPSLPVAALACPALASTARTVSVSPSTSRQYCTGAAATRFLVKTPPTTAGLSATMRQQSAWFLPDARSFALNAAALKPFGAHTPPSMVFHGPDGTRSLTGASGRTVNSSDL
mmetsp:Transcript_11678/g.54387  ORF Transcript_11678/g.54387 Transcript_11678/m.54387 type:complete len:378 (+) Transcript_11678:282-1415(+)